ncbi:hypothetical protein AOT83_06700 [Mycobacteroides sp. H001]|uniref:VOC family protein n=1 Tax=unclassified Mycobacteroides TaxID=2618759 RepID=UPI0007158D7D|nr:MULTISPECIES: VOC family protein [unclassified Mycobacteroides]KRQ20415.1 hypothetical protein AOT86_23745 [Mycobacteroides sp. H072]KRQ34240.1 hypothetical protein AOT84_18635 [Mycobacteroides sp. H002]KRQ52043.1 hypothetical protein AOT85_09435 [Mycobacteroides sp. H054]KRQ71315.1 hypothetical protein AOT83_06700 [Mycobacteroides sp. H001]
MAIDLYGISFDAHDVVAQAQFWAKALQRTVGDDATEQFATVAAGGAGTGPVLMFHQVPEAKTVKNRVHFDLLAAEVEAEARRLEELGAIRIRALADNGGRWISFADPEGNEFDLVAG